MKIGDLVTLSAYGKKVKRTGWIKEGDVGIIINCKSMAGWIDYKVMWSQSEYSRTTRGVKYKTRGSSWDWSSHFDRRDLKHVKKSS